MSIPKRSDRALTGISSGTRKNIGVADDEKVTKIPYFGWKILYEEKDGERERRAEKTETTKR